MRLVTLRAFGATLALIMATHARTAWAKSPPSGAWESSRQVHSSLLLEDLRFRNPPPTGPILTSDFSLSSQLVLDFNESEIKFDLDSLMNILRDRRHENWVLAAYPDPKTGRPLIGAGFSLDVEATEHIQRNPLNPYQFIEPSSAQLWQAAGLDLNRLQTILEEYDRDLRVWDKKYFRKKIRDHDLSPELSEEEATRLLRISTLQAVHNARAYCNDFDQLTASQQMALSQLVFQMGVNLEEFVQFLSIINDHSNDQDSATVESNNHRQYLYWRKVQRTLIQSDWARRYTSRAVAVIAMFDPDYDRYPGEAERSVWAQIHPPVRHHRRLSTARPKAKRKPHAVQRTREIRAAASGFRPVISDHTS